MLYSAHTADYPHLFRLLKTRGFLLLRPPCIVLLIWLQLASANENTLYRTLRYPVAVSNDIICEF